MQSCVYTGVCMSEYHRASKRKALHHHSEPRKDRMTPPWSPSPQTPTPRGLTSPYVGAAPQARKETAHQSREPGDVGCDSQLRKGSCAVRLNQCRQSHVSCPSGQALTTQAPKTPRSLKTWCAELADVRVLDCPLLGRNRRTRVNQGLR